MSKAGGDSRRKPQRIQSSIFMIEYMFFKQENIFIIAFGGESKSERHI